MMTSTTCTTGRSTTAPGRGGGPAAAWPPATSGSRPDAAGTAGRLRGSSPRSACPIAMMETSLSGETRRRAGFPRRTPGAGGLLGKGDRAQVRLYLAGLVLADVQAGADAADAGNAPGREVSSEQLGRLVRVAVQRCGYAGYAAGCIGYAAGCAGYGLTRTSRRSAAADDQHEQLVRSDQGQRGPRGDHGTDRAEMQACGDVRGEGRPDPGGEQPAGQARRTYTPPGGIQQHHRGAVDQAVHRHRVHLRDRPALAVDADDGQGVLIGHPPGDDGHAGHGRDGGPADSALGSGPAALGGCERLHAWPRFTMSSICSSAYCRSSVSQSKAPGTSRISATCAAAAGNCAAAWSPASSAPGTWPGMPA